MDLNEVQTFVSVVEAGSFTLAAKQLGLPKSSVSRRIAHLEESLGVRLLQRTTRKLGLTDAGRVYHEEASRAVAMLRAAGSRVAEQEGAPHGIIRVTAPADAAAPFLAELVARFVQRYPGIHVEVVLTGRTVDLVAEGFDIALRAGKLRDSSLVARKLVDASAALVASPAYLARRGTPHALGDLARHDCVLFRPVSGKNTWTVTGPDGPVSIDVTGPTGGDDFVFVRQLALADAGIALLPSLTTAADLAAKRLVPILPEYVARQGGFYLVYPSAQHLPKRVAAFRDFVMDNVQLLFRS